MRRRYGYYWTKLIVLPLALLVGLAAFVWIGDSWWQAVHRRRAGRRVHADRVPRA
ncbi:hypothetical protein L2X98_32050 [Microbacterium elymi]|uniref:Uncharacterized protein n=1 Tax=Microbacterium elymi TaxID=2909587 RepID=A0ABY5NIS1_9MICO|nr:hypothetical protein [Microbacterium elymi]UUT34991.1 hypothetical protein L2X98_32050 [Microbacterium elymi]